ncbi:hypothetical protein SDRG_04686 [Saprolegnia diclina VS20]|uniref:Uncharacterized protein n=1 Tax=Saprolegnia diclina (strain VS20) TaxID=1156394 RepID=T0QW36_SAPDV|nr:hypothetical protein SDRG_04686 [Saprolegnia diclina VS20]EQC38260.1 hypothetical protein SDRG_04686 [Saprolegnia diclina VS20]|eukprot:XP_008608587.1 hypothetical protein SDRG_04686 [Saprolegnia diclina VS20]
MAEPAAKRAEQTSLAWYDTPVVVLVLQCIPAFVDAVALLEALPPSSQTTSGSALVALHRQHGLPGHHLWPVLELDKIPHALMNLAVSALPMVPTLCVSRVQGDDIVGSVHVSLVTATMAGSDLVRSHVLSDQCCSLATFVERYGHAIVRIALNVRGDAATGAVASALQHCTRPRQLSLELSVDAVSSIAPLLASIATHALGALSLCIERPSDDDDDDDDGIPAVLCPPMLLSWLALPVASSLRLVNVTFTNPGSLRQALCGLHNLELVRVHDLLVDASDAPRLSALQSLVATNVRLPSVHGLLCQLSAKTLTHLDLDGPLDWSPLLAALKHLVALHLHGGTMTALGQVDVARVPQLQTVKLSRVHVPDKDAPILVAWLDTAEALRELHWTHSALAMHGPVAVAHALPRWLRLGLQTLTLANNFISDDAALVLSMAIAKGGNTTDVALDLSANVFKLPGLRALLLALSASVKLSIRLDGLQLMRRHLEELGAFAAAHGVQCDAVTQVYTPPPADKTRWRL